MKGRTLLERLRAKTEEATLKMSRAPFAAEVRNNPRPNARIEAIRERLIEDSRLLIDDTFDLPGPYDQNQTVSDVCKVSKPPRPAACLGALASSAKSILELGTNVGISAAYLATSGESVTTLEASPYRLRIARAVHAELGLTNISYVHGLFADTLEDTLQRLAPLDFVFIDGHHQYRPTLDYFAAIRPFTTPDCLFVFDDVRWSEGMKTAWRQLKANFRYTGVIGGMGLAARIRNASGG